MGNWISSLLSGLVFSPKWLLLIPTGCTELYVEGVCLSAWLLKLLPPWDLSTIHLKLDWNSQLVLQRLFDNSQAESRSWPGWDFDLMLGKWKGLLYLWSHCCTLCVVSDKSKPNPSISPSVWGLPKGWRRMVCCMKPRCAAGVALVSCVNAIFHLYLRKFGAGLQGCSPAGFHWLLPPPHAAWTVWALLSYWSVSIVYVVYIYIYM